jgi:hypothetical protein
MHDNSGEHSNSNDVVTRKHERSKMMFGVTSYVGVSDRVCAFVQTLNPRSLMMERLNKGVR